MLDMTVPEFQAAAKADIVFLPIGSIGGRWSFRIFAE
jgi:hypothetical protein